MGETIERGRLLRARPARASVLETPGLEIGILETARGGMLLRGMGVTANDVSVVTNVTADHLGLQGIDTLDQLAEVKAIVTTGDQARGLGRAQRRGPAGLGDAAPASGPSRGRSASTRTPRPCARPSAPAAGRITVLDGEIVVLTPDADPDRLVRIVDVPMTLSGPVAPQHRQRARRRRRRARASGIAALGRRRGAADLPPRPVLNPGRLNTYSLPLERGRRHGHHRHGAQRGRPRGAARRRPRARRARRPGAPRRSAAAGDRTDDAIQALGEIAGQAGRPRRRSPTRPKYLRGRSTEDIDGAPADRAGARSGSATSTSYATELDGAAGASSRRWRDGDVVAFMCHDSQPAVRAWLAEHGATVDDPRTIRRKVVARPGRARAGGGDRRAVVDDRRRGARRGGRPARGAAPGRRPAGVRAGRAPTTPPATRPARSALYEGALAGGLREPYRHRAQIQAASTLRNLGDHERALRLLDEVEVTHPGNVAVAAFRALVLVDCGRAGDAVADLVDSLVDHAADEDAAAYRRSLHAYAARLRDGVTAVSE